MKATKLLSLILAVAMIMSTMSLSVFAAETTLPAAVNGVITLTEDVTLAETFTVAEGTNLTIDLNGKNITVAKDGAKSLYAFDNYGTLTLKDSVGTGSVTSRGIYNHGTMTVESGKYVACDTDGGASLNNRGKLTVNGGVITTVEGLATGIWNQRTATETVINGGDISCYSTYNTTAVNNEAGTLIINGGSFSCTHTVLATKMPVTINGGTFTCFGMENHTSHVLYAFEEGSYVVNDGTFVNNNDTKYGCSNVYINSTSTAVIKGGSYSDNSAKKYVAPGSVITINGEQYRTDENGSTKPLPKAEVTKLPKMTLTAADHSYMCWPNGDATINRPLEIVMNFKTKETTEEARPNGYLPWKVDFYLTFEGMSGNSITADNCYLAGKYGTFGWIVIPTDGLVLENGVCYPVVSAYDANITYKQICDTVKDFTAAIHVDQAILDANPDMTVKLELKMTNPDNADDVLVIGEPAVYTAEDLATKEDTVIEMDDPEVELCEDGYYRCIKDGVPQVGWVTTNAGYRYYFSKAAATYGAAMIGKNKRVGSQYYDFYVDGRLIESYEENGTPILYKHKNGFITEDGITRYYDDNVYRIGWQYIDGYKYYFSKATGTMLSGTNQIGHEMFNLDENGKWIGYYQDPIAEVDCPKATEVVKDEDGKYRYYVDGAAYKGWKMLPGEDGYYKYYFSATDGAAITKYASQIGAEIFDFRPAGTYVKVENVDGDAVMTDYVLSLEQGAKNGIVLDEDGKYRYYIDGEYQIGWQTIDGKEYLFKRADGSAITSADHNVNDNTSYRYGRVNYTFDEFGVLLSKSYL